MSVLPSHSQSCHERNQKHEKTRSDMSGTKVRPRQEHRPRRLVSRFNRNLMGLLVSPHFSLFYSHWVCVGCRTYLNTLPSGGQCQEQLVSTQCTRSPSRPLKMNDYCEEFNRINWPTKLKVKWINPPLCRCTLVCSQVQICNCQKYEHT